MKNPLDFGELYKTLSLAELLDILEHRENYQPIAIEAATKELCERQPTEEEVNEARGSNSARDLEKQQDTEKIKAVGDKVKNAGQLLVDSFITIQPGDPNPEKLIRSISVGYGCLFIYQIFKEHRLLLTAIKDIAREPVYGALVVVPVFILVPAVIGFWNKKPAGWVLLGLIATFFSGLAISMLRDSLRPKFGAFAAFDKLFPRPSPIVPVIQLVLFIGTLYIICKPEIRDAFHIGKEKMKFTIAAGALVTLILLFVF